MDQRRTTTLQRGGRHDGHRRGETMEIQRRRLLAAAADVLVEVGYARLTVALVISRARVSRRTFYELFANCEDCFLGVLEQTLAEATLLATEAYERGADWREGVRLALARLLAFIDEEPELARLWVVETLAAGGQALERRARVLEELARVVDRGRSVTNATREPPKLTAEGVVGGIVAVLQTRLLEERAEPFTDLHGSMMSMIVLPYLGASAANRELSRPPLEIPRDRPARTRAGGKDPIAGLNMRLTYRTVQVLAVIAEHPGASNREIAKGSGIADEGQTSRLLKRLARLNLVENLGEGQEKGAANAWYLTARGTQLERASRFPGLGRAGEAATSSPGRPSQRGVPPAAPSGA